MKNMMNVSMVAYFCRVSDPRYGGIYLTLLWTMVGIGNHWTATLSLYFVDILTAKTCNDVSKIRHRPTVYFLLTTKQIQCIICLARSDVCLGLLHEGAASQFSLKESFCLIRFSPKINPLQKRVMYCIA